MNTGFPAFCQDRPSSHPATPVQRSVTEEFTEGRRATPSAFGSLHTEFPAALQSDDGSHISVVFEAEAKLERPKGFESIRDHRPVSAKTGVFMHISTSNTCNAFWPARSQNTFWRSWRSGFVIQSHASPSGNSLGDQMSKTRSFREVMIEMDECRHIQRVSLVTPAMRSSGFFRYSCVGSGRSFGTWPPWSRT